MSILFGSIGLAACAFYVHVLVQFMRDTDRKKLERPQLSPDDRSHCHAC